MLRSFLAPLSIRALAKTQVISRWNTAALSRLAGDDYGQGPSFFPVVAPAAVLLLAGLAAATDGTTLSCEQQKEQHDEEEQEELPVYTASQVAAHNGLDGRPIWMTYGGMVLDVTTFVANHPGGSEKIMEAAGSAIEPFWFSYRQHFASDLPMSWMEKMVVGRLAEADQEAIDAKVEAMDEFDPYAKEPVRNPAYLVHSDAPMNAEVPAEKLTESYLTPNDLFYIRNHQPVPHLSKAAIESYKLTIDLSDYNGKVIELSLDEIKKLPKIERAVTLQCSGNRRSQLNTKARTSGTPWGQGAVSTARFTGVRMRDLLQLAGLDDDVEDHHVRFQALDGMKASVGTEKALNPYGDCMVAYEMNGEPLPRDHGVRLLQPQLLEINATNDELQFPLRVIVPGHAAIRNVKWLERIELSKEEAEGVWQRGLNYKILPPSVSDAGSVDLLEMPSVSEVSLFSGITKVEPIESDGAGTTKLKVFGWAWAGGGRNIVRVDITSDNGKTWSTAKLNEGKDQRRGRAWAWVFWEGVVEVPTGMEGDVQLASKAVDHNFNIQPHDADWNVRGLGNNSWYRVKVKLPTPPGPSKQSH